MFNFETPKVVNNLPEKVEQKNSGYNPENATYQALEKNERFNLDWTIKMLKGGLEEIRNNGRTTPAGYRAARTILGEVENPDDADVKYVRQVWENFARNNPQEAEDLKAKAKLIFEGYDEDGSPK